MNTQLIVALDVPDRQSAQQYVKLLVKENTLFKVGLRLFVAEGPDVVRMVQEEGGDVFLDLKFHDIPNTVAQACEAALNLKPFMLNIHAVGGSEMARAAVAALKNSQPRPLLVGVTVLTSDPEETSTKEVVRERALLCQKEGLDGVVCSPQEIQIVRQTCGEKFVIVTPGIRLPSDSPDDQKRTSTPLEAAKAGAHYIVMGRPILTSKDPLKTVREIKNQLR